MPVYSVLRWVTHVVPDCSQRNLNSLPLFTGTISFGPVYSIPDFILPILSDGRESSDMHIYGWHLEFQPLEALSSFVKYHSKKNSCWFKGSSDAWGVYTPMCIHFVGFLGTHERFQRTQTKECRQSQTKLVTNCLKCLLVLLSTAAYLETTLGL